jgi:hypothetical protein
MCRRLAKVQIYKGLMLVSGQTEIRYEDVSKWYGTGIDLISELKFKHYGDIDQYEKVVGNVNTGVHIGII